jgi:hypothetical protein
MGLSMCPVRALLIPLRERYWEKLFKSKRYNASRTFPLYCLQPEYSKTATPHCGNCSISTRLAASMDRVMRRTWSPRRWNWCECVLPTHSSGSGPMGRSLKFGACRSLKGALSPHTWMSPSTGKTLKRSRSLHTMMRSQAWLTDRCSGTGLTRLFAHAQGHWICGAQAGGP